MKDIDLLERASDIDIEDDLAVQNFFEDMDALKKNTSNRVRRIADSLEARLLLLRQDMVRDRDVKYFVDMVASPESEELGLTDCAISIAGKFASLSPQFFPLRNKLQNFCLLAKVVHDIKGQDMMPEMQVIVGNISKLTQEEYNNPISLLVKGIMKGQKSPERDRTNPFHQP